MARPASSEEFIPSSVCLAKVEREFEVFCLQSWCHRTVLMISSYSGITLWLRIESRFCASRRSLSSLSLGVRVIELVS